MERPGMDGRGQEGRNCPGWKRREERDQGGKVGGIGSAREGKQETGREGKAKRVQVENKRAIEVRKGPR